MQIKVYAMIACGFLLGGLAGYLTADTAVAPRYAWRVARTSDQGPQDDTECYPAQTIASAAELSIIRRGIDSLHDEMPDAELASLRNLIQDENAPISYAGQRAIRSASILLSIKQHAECRMSGIADCSTGKAEHIINPMDRTGDARPSIERYWGRWEILTQIDIVKSTFCRLERVQ